MAPPAANAGTDYTPQAKQIIEQLVAGKYATVVESFDATVRKALPPEKVEEVWKGAIGQYGSWRRIETTRREVAGKYEVVFVTCAFEHGKLDSKFVFSADGKVAGWFFLPAGSYRSPAYVDADKFEEVEVSIGKGSFLLTLPGTLTLPKQEGKLPAIVLVHGSGPNDRDETIGPNKPFRDLAHGLATRGVAVLRYEKRTKQHPLAMTLMQKLTVKEETIDDAVEAVNLLARHERIDPKRIYLLGHSLGGMLIPRIAARQDKVAVYVSLAGSTRPLEDIILDQMSYILSLDGLSAAEEKGLDELKAQVALVKSDKLTGQTPAKDLPLNIPPAYWLDLRDYQPAEAGKGIRQSMLIQQGERDYQVTLDDFARWKTALADRPNVTFRSYPTLNHLFMPGKGKSRPAEYTQPGNVAEEVVADIAKWIEAQTTRGS
jgi:dienelactone hydrolase